MAGVAATSPGIGLGLLPSRKVPVFVARVARVREESRHFGTCCLSGITEEEKKQLVLLLTIGQRLHVVDHLKLPRPSLLFDLMSR